MVPVLKKLLLEPHSKLVLSWVSKFNIHIRHFGSAITRVRAVSTA